MIVIIFSVIDALIMHFTIDLFFERKYNNIISVLCLLLLMAFNYFAGEIESELNLPVFMAAYLCYSLLFKARTGYRVFIVMIYMTLLLISEFVVMGILNIVFGDGWSGYIWQGMIMSYIVYILFIFIFKKFFATGFKGVPYRYAVSITITLVLFFASLYVISDIIYEIEIRVRLTYFVIGIVIFVAVIMLVYIFSSLCNYYNLYIESSEKVMVDNVIQAHYKNVEKINSEMAKLAHDYKNQINTLKTLIKYDKAESYIDEISKKLEKTITQYTGNNIADIVINDKVKSARDKNIDIKIIGYMDKNNISPYDICSLFSNILDNAIEASEKSLNKRIIFKLDSKGDYIHIHCENTYDRDPVVMNNCILSNKKSLNHGIGLKIIDEIVKKYKGYMDIKYEDNIFETDILITRKLGD